MEVIASPSTAITPSTWITMSGRTITWQTTNPNNIGSYTIKIIGSLPTTPTFSSYFTFQLVVEFSCAYCSDSPVLLPSQTADVSFTFGLSESVTPQAFTISSGTSTYCDQNDIVYSLTSPSADITFDPITRTITWSSSLLCTNYNLPLVGTITTLASSPSVTSTIVLKCS